MRKILFFLTTLCLCFDARALVTPDNYEFQQSMKAMNNDSVLQECLNKISQDLTDRHEWKKLVTELFAVCDVRKKECEYVVEEKDTNTNFVKRILEGMEKYCKDKKLQIYAELKTATSEENKPFIRIIYIPETDANSTEADKESVTFDIFASTFYKFITGTTHAILFSDKRLTKNKYYSKGDLGFNKFWTQGCSVHNFIDNSAFGAPTIVNSSIKNALFDHMYINPDLSTRRSDSFSWMTQYFIDFAYSFPGILMMHVPGAPKNDNKYIYIKGPIDEASHALNVFIKNIRNTAEPIISKRTGVFSFSEEHKGTCKDIYAYVVSIDFKKDLSKKITGYHSTGGEDRYHNFLKSHDISGVVVRSDGIKI